MFRPMKRFTVPFAVLAIALVASLAVVDSADARRGGSFGSRGARTWSAPAATTTAPMPAAPIQRSMTAPSANPAAAAPAAAAARGGFFGGFGGSLLGGLALGGLIGMLLGNGIGGFAGGLGFILQFALLAFGAMALMRFFANRSRPAAAGGAPIPDAAPRQAFGGLGGFGLGSGLGGGQSRPAAAVNARNARDEVGITDSDLDLFERRLDEVQSAFTREDYSALRGVTTPEIMSYLSEELAQNATGGLRNDVTDVKLLQGDLAEAWREGDTDYATVAMRYESRDVMRDRASGEIVSGAAERSTETTEIWTFARRSGEDWKLSAIQEI